MGFGSWFSSKMNSAVGRSHATVTAGNALVATAAAAPSSPFIFLVFAALVSFTHASRGVVTFGAVDAGFIMLFVALAWFAAHVYGDGSMKAFGRMIIVSAIAYVWPLLMSILAEKTTIVPREVAIALMVFGPFWLFYIAFHPTSSRLTQLFSAVFLCLWILYLVVQVALPAINPDMQATRYLVSPGEVPGIIVDGFNKVEKPVKGAVVDIVTNTKNIVTGKANNVTQEFYHGQVDQNQGLPLGVFFTDVKPMLQRFNIMDGDDIIVDATMRGRTLGDDTIDVSNVCYLRVPGNILTAPDPIPGTILPSKIIFTYSGDVQDIRPIECQIPNDALRAKASTMLASSSAEVVFNSTFGYQTWGYEDYAFMDRTLLNAIRQDGKDPATAMGLSSSVAVARYTPGPVMIGMSGDTMPLAFDETASDRDATLPPFGVTFANNWQGRGGIVGFDNVEIYVPKPFKLKEDDSGKIACSPSSVNVTSIKPIDKRAGFETYNAYKVDASSFKIRSSQNYVTLRCPITIPKDAKESVLGSSGTGLYSFMVYAKYNFSLEYLTSVQVVARQVDAPSGSTSGSGSSTPSAVTYIVQASKQSCISNVQAPTQCIGGVCTCYTTNTDLSEHDLQRCSWPSGNPSAAVCEIVNLPSPNVCSSQVQCTGDKCTCTVLTQRDPVEHQQCAWSRINPFLGAEPDCKVVT